MTFSHEFALIVQAVTSEEIELACEQLLTAGRKALEGGSSSHHPPAAANDPEGERVLVLASANVMRVDKPAKHGCRLLSAQ